jgi:hypothetical protein
METPAQGSFGLECLSGQYAVQVTLEDLDTGNVEVVQACFVTNPDIPHQCANLATLAVTYTPNDWDAECVP